MCAGDVTDYGAMRSRAQLNAVAAAAAARQLPLRTNDNNFMMRAKAGEQDVRNCFFLCSPPQTAAVNNRRATAKSAARTSSPTATAY